MRYDSIISDVYNAVMAEENSGELACYIPALAEVDPNKFGIHLTTLAGDEFGIGNSSDRFSIQSIAKVLSVSLAYGMLGESIWQRLGVEPSGTSFNSLVQLEADHGIPRNPLINAGAIVICDMLISQLSNAKSDFLDFVRDLADNPHLQYSSDIAESEKSVGYRNIALCNFIKSFGNLHNKPDEVLDFYFNLCSLEMNCQELAHTFVFLANGGCKLSDGKTILTSSQAKRINALMQTCGFYDESGEFAFKVGLPGKSGVGGGIVAVHPDHYVITVWSPKLNAKGNSYRGIKFLERFTTQTQLSIF